VHILATAYEFRELCEFAAERMKEPAELTAQQQIRLFRILYHYSSPGYTFRLPQRAVGPKFKSYQNLMRDLMEKDWKELLEAMSSCKDLSIDINVLLNAVAPPSDDPTTTQTNPSEMYINTSLSSDLDSLAIREVKYSSEMSLDPISIRKVTQGSEMSLDCLSIRYSSKMSLDPPTIPKVAYSSAMSLDAPSQVHSGSGYFNSICMGQAPPYASVHNADISHCGGRDVEGDFGFGALNLRTPTDHQKPVPGTSTFDRPRILPTKNGIYTARYATTLDDQPPSVAQGHCKFPQLTHWWIGCEKPPNICAIDTMASPVCADQNMTLRAVSGRTAVVVPQIPDPFDKLGSDNGDWNGKDDNGFEKYERSKADRDDKFLDRVLREWKMEDDRHHAFWSMLEEMKEERRRRCPYQLPIGQDKVRKYAGFGFRYPAQRIWGIKAGRCKGNY
jgi:hypothetical protein